MIGGELLQFGNAAPLGNGLWTLSTLWRGRRGTEDRVGGHAIGDPFTLLTSNTIASLTIPAGVAQLRVIAQGVGDSSSPPESDVTSPGLALRPLSPIWLTATPQSNGDLVLSWIRRSRDGWRWDDGVDAPLGEEQELYSLSFTLAFGAARTVQSSTASYTYTTAQQAVDAAAGAHRISVAVSQIGTYQTSLSATLTIPLT